MREKIEKMIVVGISKIVGVCKNYEVEINVNAEGSITLYAELPGGIDVEYQHVAVKDISGAIEQLNDFRRSGWTGN